jgi:hypothetical protein
MNLVRFPCSANGYILPMTVGSGDAIGGGSSREWRRHRRRGCESSVAVMLLRLLRWWLCRCREIWLW